MDQTSHILQLSIYAIYYIVIAGIAGLSLFGVYILTSYGRSRILSLAVSLIYIAVFLILFASSQSTLHSLFA